ncbi:MAG: purine-nucleoside phosphorylase [Clostridia bacterium]|nr:purine-nucleoside phosphorylase [Clostridia bacterium]
MEKLIDNIIKQINKKVNTKPSVAVILGSGLGSFVSQIKNRVEIAYSSLKGMPVSTVAGHSGKFIFGEIEGKSIVAMQGRIHLYEGYTAKQVTLPIYLFKKLGVKSLVVTNASGGVNELYKAGDLMVICDQINLTGQNPLVAGATIDYGVKFIDMMDAYNKEYIKLLNDIGKKHNLELKNGTYLQLLGPSYETPAEVKMARIIGADAVGMSTAVEVIAAAQAGLKTAGISVVSNMAVGITDEKISHEKVLKVMKQTEQKFSLLLLEFIKKLKK